MKRTHKCARRGCRYMACWRVAGKWLCGIHENMVIRRLLNAEVITHATSAWPDFELHWIGNKHVDQAAALRQYVPEVWR